jgi:hypothetical protein
MKELCINILYLQFVMRGDVKSVLMQQLTHNREACSAVIFSYLAVNHQLR